MPKKKVKEEKIVVKEKIVEKVVPVEVAVELPTIGGKKAIKIVSETDTEILYSLEDGTTTFVQK